MPRQKFIEAGGRVIVDPAEHVGEPGLRIDVVELGGADQRIDGGGPLIAKRFVPARAREIGWKGAGGWVIVSQRRQVNFSPTVWITFHCRGTTSSVREIAFQEELFSRPNTSLFGTGQILAR